MVVNSQHFRVQALKETAVIPCPVVTKCVMNLRKDQEETRVSSLDWLLESFAGQFFWLASYF